MRTFKSGALCRHARLIRNVWSFSYGSCLASKCPNKQTYEVYGVNKQGQTMIKYKQTQLKMNVRNPYHHHQPLNVPESSNQFGYKNINGWNCATIKCTAALVCRPKVRRTHSRRAVQTFRTPHSYDTRSLKST